MPHVQDRGSRIFWQLTGRRIDLAGTHGWLEAPFSHAPRVSTDWLEAEAVRHSGVADVGPVGAGLLPSLSVLDGPDFDSARLHPMVWTGWSPIYRLERLP